MPEKRNTNSSSKIYPFKGMAGLKYVDCLLFAILGYLVIYFFARYSGIGISPDSIMYASTAQNLHDHFSIITFNGKPLTFFPVFYPFFLSICIFISGGVDPVSAGPVINGILFGAVIFTTGWLTTRFKNPSVVYKWLILIAVLLAPALQEIYTYLWSETLFILEILIFVIAYRNYLHTHTFRALLLAALAAAIGCITRYAGVTLIGAGCLLLLIDTALQPKKKLAHLFVFSLASISLLVCNLVMNRINTGLSTGTREPSITPLTENLYYFGTVILDWAGLPASFDPIATVFALVVVFGLIGLLLWKAFSLRLDSYENVIIAYAVVYSLFIIISASVSRFERINSRLISPLFVPLLLGCTCWVPDIIKTVQFNKKWMLALPCVLAMLAFEYVIARIDYQRYDDFRDYGIPGYTDDDWNKSDFVVFLNKHRTIYKPGIAVYSDADEAVYMFARMHSTLLPHKFFKKDVEAFFKHPQFYLIDFKKQESAELVSLDDIKAKRKVTTLYNFEDGAIYLCEPK